MHFQLQALQQVATNLLVFELLTELTIILIHYLKTARSFLIRSPFFSPAVLRIRCTGIHTGPRPAGQEADVREPASSGRMSGSAAKSPKNPRIACPPYSPFMIL